MNHPSSTTCAAPSPHHPPATFQHHIPRRRMPFYVTLIRAALVSTALFGWGRDAVAVQITVPVDVGVGPAFYHGTGPAFADAPGHYGIRFSLAAIINQALIRKHINRVPKQYRQTALRMREFRYRPSIFIPSALFISPKVGKTGIYGATWRPIGLSVPLSRGPVVFDIQAGILLTYAFLHSDNAAFAPTNGIMHFLRPGVEIGPRVEISVTDNFLISFGWNAQLYVPQMVGGAFLALPNPDNGGLANSLWFVGQGWLKLHFRFPYTTNI